MARHETDREDLMREAVRLVPRAAWHVPHEPDEVVIGFRGKALSVYFGPDPVYHFNEAGELRRAFVDGLLWKAEHGTLLVMQRHRSADATALRSRAMPPSDQRIALQEVGRRLEALADAIALSRAHCHVCVPSDADIAPRLLDTLRSVVLPIRPARRPGLRRQ